MTRASAPPSAAASGACPPRDRAPLAAVDITISCDLSNHSARKRTAKDAPAAYQKPLLLEVLSFWSLPGAASDRCPARREPRRRMRYAVARSTPTVRYRGNERISGGSLLKR